MTPLRATVRLQLHAGFDFDAAAAQVDYFARLGISHLYLSPVAQAVAGSLHGYDNIDPGVLSRDLGGEAGFIRLSDAVRAHGMGILLDIVPNHMAADPSNRWWSDVLREGRRSQHASWFDIDWDAPGSEGKLWLPVLDRPLADALADGVLQLEVGDAGPRMRHHDLCIPLSPLSFPAPAAGWGAWAERCRASAARMQDLLQRQAWRLAWWRSGADRVNYRRFFDINGLVALRVEDPDVFDAVHALPLRLIAEGRVDGLRIDHIDGLTDPAGYLRRLRSALDSAGARAGVGAGQVSLHVEKILADAEDLPTAWQCDGSTGYDFMDQAGGLLHAVDSEAQLQTLWQDFSGDRRSFAAVQREARAQVLSGSLQGDLDRCLGVLVAAAAVDADSADLSPRMFERALVMLLRYFPVYRSHGLQSAVDRQWLREAADSAQRELDPADRVALARLCALLCADNAGENNLLRRFEQLAAPLNAKAVEDTAFYRFARLLSRNEVGSDPARISWRLDRFVERANTRAQHWPRALLALATHDHKRGPDARCRLACLSWNVTAWAQQLEQWEQLAEQAGQPCPLPAAERMMLWQTVLGSWPLQAEALQPAYIERLRQWLVKALREGKRVSSWSDPASAREQAAADWLAWLGSAPAASTLRSAIAAFVHALAPHAARLGLVQVALQGCCPGVPDLYQGNEGWDTSLVDPDNRRSVDFQQRRQWLAAPLSWDAALRDWTGGAPKALLTARLLQHRAAHPALFEQAPLRVLPSADAVVMLLRTHGTMALLLAIDRDARLLRGPLQGLCGPVADGPTAAGLAALMPGKAWRNLMDGRRWANAQGEPSETLLGGSPVAVWVTDEGESDGR